MIRPLRRVHGVVMVALAIVLPLLLAAAVVWREPRLAQQDVVPGGIR